MLENDKLLKIYPILVSNPENWIDAFRMNVGILRTHFKWSVRVLSEKSGVSEDSINNFLKGKTKDCTISFASKIAIAFGVTIDELIGAGTMADTTRQCVQESRSLPPWSRLIAQKYIHHLYKVHLQLDEKGKTIDVMLPECQNHYLLTTNINEQILIEHLTPAVRSKVSMGLKIPCEHYEPHYFQDEIILIAGDRDAVHNEKCVISYNGHYYIVKKIFFIENGVKKWKYVSIFNDKTEFSSSEIEDKIGYIVGFLEPDLTWGIR